MRRRMISIGSLLIAVAALAVVLANATLIDRRGPGVTGIALSAPADGQASVAHTVTALVIQFSEPVRSVTFEPRFAIEPYVPGSISYEGSTAIFTPAQKLPPDTAFTISIAAGFEDLAGNASTSGVEAFAFRTLGPPAVATVDPGDGGEGVPVDAPLTLTFDRLMDTTAVEEAVSIQPAVPIRPSWSGRVLTLGFDGPLEFGTTYRLTVGTGAADTDGSRLREAFTTSFTTAEAGLAIVRTLPADGVAGVSVRSPIAVVFDGPVDPESVEDALTITPGVGGAIRVVALPDDAIAPRPESGAAVVVLLQPDQPLAAHTTYTVRLEPVVTMTGAPDQVSAGRTWRFTTGQPPASAHNQIAFLATRAGTRDVWLMNPDGSAPRQLTSGLAAVTAFDVTLDGTQVAFAAGGVIRTMATDGSGETVRTTDGRFEYAPRYSPDGRWLLVARREPDGTDVGWWLTPIAAGVGGERQLLSTGAPPIGSAALEGEGIESGDGLPAWAGRAAWDPTGRWILLTAATGQVVLVDLAPEEPEPPMPVGLTAAAAGSWSPSGARFVVVGRDAAATSDGLYTVDTNGRVDRVADASGSAVAASAGRVAMLSTVGGTTHVALGDVEGDAPPEPLTSGSGLADRWPAFSPDGRSIVFGRVDAGSPTTSQGIWTVDVAGGGPVALTTDGAYPRWLP